MPVTEIEHLPDFPAIQQINEALWRRGRVRGAAVLVGAGFSRNAKRIHADTPLPPLWGDITNAIATRLGYGKNHGKDPLRLAEEFVVLLGRPALEEMLRELVLDDQWLPGELHEKLVSLNWKEILTTNWDTLLERAAERNLESGYDVVRCVQDLSTSGSPRVVKLHGSFPANRPFILSEEDYRKYPKAFAPFVNLVQQTLLENELCLLGFSGDDPNFLQWTGWIRDHLGDAARRIYLVGVLRMNPAQRRLLETRNITPVDLAPLVEEQPSSRAHELATGLFLEFLRTHRPPAPWSWTGKDVQLYPKTLPLPPSNQIAELMLKTGKEWAELRQSYPGWLVCPRESRDYLKREVYEWLERVDALNELSAQQRATFIYEAVWRLNTALMPLGHHLAAVTAAANDEEAWIDTDQRAFVLTVLLAECRQDRDREAFDQISAALASMSMLREDFVAKTRYEAALWARDSLAFASLAELQEHVIGQDPVWRLRRAGLLANLGKWEESRALIREAWIDIRNQHLRDRNSIWSLSRLAWCHLVVRQATDWLTLKNEEQEAEADQLRVRIHEEKCDPWDWLLAVDRDVHEKLSSQKARKPYREPTFDVGHYRQHSITLFSGAWPAQPVYDYERLAEQTGIPWRFSNVQTFVKRLEEAEPLAVSDGVPDMLFLLRLFQDDGREPIERRLGRLQVALLPDEAVALSIQHLRSAIEYASTRLPERQGWADQFWSGRMGSYLQVLSRLVIRLPEDSAITSLKLGFELVHNPHCQVLEIAGELDDMINRSFSALSQGVKRTLLTDLLSVPLAEESKMIPGMGRRWPKVWELIKEAAEVDLSTAQTSKQRIDQLVTAVQVMSEVSRSEAALRLLVLHDQDLLTPEQKSALSASLWSRVNVTSGFPADASLLPHVYFRLASPDGVNVKALYKRYIAGPLTPDVLTSLSALDGVKAPYTKEVFDEEEREQLLGRLLEWRPVAAGSDFMGQISIENSIAGRYVGEALVTAVLRSFSPGQLSPGLAQRLVAAQTDVPTLVQSFADVARLFPESADKVTNRMSEMLLAAGSDEVWAIFLCLRNWLKLHQENLIVSIPHNLLESLVWFIEMRRIAGLSEALWISSLIVDASLFSESLCIRLARALGTLFAQTAYAVVQSTPMLAEDVSRIRVHCVRLAHAIENRGLSNAETRLWLDAYGSDPMPEVRFAIPQG